jgi:hypothetical protein
MLERCGTELQQYSSLASGLRRCFRQCQALRFFAACVAFRNIIFAFVVTHSPLTKPCFPGEPSSIGAASSLNGEFAAQVLFAPAGWRRKTAAESWIERRAPGLAKVQN